MSTGEDDDRLNVNNEDISEVKHAIYLPTHLVTPLPTQVEAVETINRMAGKEEIKFKLPEQTKTRM